jgi:hypothetical protein
MIDLQNVTLVGVSSVRIEELTKALLYSKKEINFGEVKLITDKPVEHKEIITVPCKEMKNTDDYSYYIVYELFKHINTDYVLIVQDDGFVVNPHQWKNIFFQYDYIGAPFALPKDNFSYRDIFGNIFRVGNGGFSFRTKKLLKLATDLNLEWKDFHGYYNEDGFFCALNKHIYEQNDCKFAPIDIAKFFSHEANIPEIQNIIPFGFHGKYSPYRSLLQKINL